MGVELFREPLHRKYYASRCSCAYLFWLGCLVVLVLLPFFLAYSSENFWLKENTYREQPDARYKYQLLILLEGQKTSQASNFQLFFSTLNTLNAWYNNIVRVPVVKSREVDDNHDGIMDRLELSVEMPIQSDESIYTATLVVFFDYRLRSRAAIRMETMAYVTYGSGVPGSSFFVDGDLVLRQSWPFQVVGGYRTLYSKEPLLDLSSPSTCPSDVLLTNLIRKYRARNHTSDYNMAYSVWQRGLVGQQDYMTSVPVFNTTAVIRIPITRVSYTPDVSEVLKVAWIQYLAMLVIVGFLLDRLCSFVYAHQVVETRLKVEAPASSASIKYHQL